MSLTFSLLKWHMDLVADDGEAVVAYAAEVRLSAITLRYAGMLHQRKGRTRSVSSLRGAMPRIDGGTLTWSSRALGASGTWRAEREGTRDTLLLNDSGSVEWNCLMPLARAEIEMAEGRCVRGLGYAEELRMTIAPWDLPIDELHWGRFTGPGTSVVWLDWRGSHAKKLILKNGARMTGNVQDRTIEIAEDDAKLLMEEGHVLRDGPLGSNALAAIAELHAMLPVKLLATSERKVCAPAVLEQPFSPSVRGWTISEVVKWG